MASNNTVEMVVKVTDEATAPLQGISDGVSKLIKNLTGLSTTELLGVSVAIGTIVEVSSKMITESSALQDATFRLDNVYEAFSSTLHVSRQELEDFTDSARQNSRFSNVAIEEMQETLLKFGTITGDTFKRAQQDALDLGAQMNDLGQAAYIVGRALAAPEQSARLLRQAGVVLTTAQKDLIKSFDDVGDSAGAANVILTEIEKRYSEVAAKDLDTFSGSVKHLTNTFDEMFQQTNKLSIFTAAVQALDAALQKLSDIHFGANMQALFSAIPGVGFASPKDFDNRVQGSSPSTRGGLGLTDDPIPITKEQIKSLSDYSIKLIQAHSAELVANLHQSMAAVEESGKTLDELKKASDDAFSSEIEGAKASVEAQEENLKAMEAWYKLSEEVAGANQHLGEDLSEMQKETAESGKKIFAQMDQDARDAENIHKTMIKNIQNVFAGFFENLKGGFKGLLSAFAEMLLQMVAQAAAAQLTTALFGGSAPGSGGGLLGTIGGAIFGSGGGGGAAAGAVNSGIVGPRASGGSTSGLTLVGEEGPELIATGPARVLNSRQLAFAGAGGGGAVHFAPVTNIVMQPKDADAQSLRNEFYAAIDMNNKKLKTEVYTTLDRNGLGKMR